MDAHAGGRDAPARKIRRASGSRHAAVHLEPSIPPSPLPRPVNPRPARAPSSESTLAPSSARLHALPRSFFVMSTPVLAPWPSRRSDAGAAANGDADEDARPLGMDTFNTGSPGPRHAARPHPPVADDSPDRRQPSQQRQRCDDEDDVGKSMGTPRALDFTSEDVSNLIGELVPDEAAQAADPQQVRARSPFFLSHRSASRRTLTPSSCFGC